MAAGFETRSDEESALRQLARRFSGQRTEATGDNYKWIALSNTTLGVLMATINSSIILISLPAIFNGIGINPLAARRDQLFLLAAARLYGRHGDITRHLRAHLRHVRARADVQPRLRHLHLGSILLFLTPGSGNTAALEMILFRIVQGIGAGFLFANSAAILTDAFPARQRGMAMGINQMAAIVGSLAGLILGGVLSVINWRMIFLISVPIRHLRHHLGLPDAARECPRPPA